MSKYNDKQIREVFHLLFLERLLKICDPRLFALKGGVNLRFFLGSPRYSEDMDLDIFGGSVETLKKNGYKILEDKSFRRVLKTYGISNLLINDKNKAKHTETTQRFRLRLVNEVGEEFPTKVEFSRRKTKNEVLEFKKELIRPEVIRPYNRSSYLCQHYLFNSAAVQKVRALANRNEIQARDPFDLFYIYSTGKFNANDLKLVDRETKQAALENFMSISFVDYHSQVVEYLEIEQRQTYGDEDYWNAICETLVNLLTEV
ncbi:MAG: nucleotidyl transferase AbiEii/AbiGii toxin family protein [Bacteriovoracaceae bacterium]|nr:nucleotidyl transferase AbiEii/AbiGii toxin family protein [Bacteriovoracaceae bacterium]